MIVMVVCLRIPLILFGLYMYIDPFIVPTITGFGVPFEVMEALSMHTINDPFRRLSTHPFTVFLIPELEGSLR